MLNLLAGMVVAFAMYSKIPMPHLNWNERNMRYAMCYFPMIGAVIGLVMNLWFRLAEYAGYGVIFRTGVLILIPVLISGGIHLDGLLDTADALSSWKSMEEKLEILKDSNSGAFAIITGICYFILDFCVFTECDADDLKIIGLSFVLSRALSAFAVVKFRKAKNTGLLRAFSDAAVGNRVALVSAIWAVVIVCAAIALDPRRGIMMTVCTAAVYWFYRHMSYKKFGGITGDLAGWFVQICELAVAIGVILI